MVNTILHGVFSGPFLLAWEFEPYISFLLVFSAGLYLLALRRIQQRGVRAVPRNYPVYFYSGMIAFVAALAGPFEYFNENSFALHMSQHVIIMLVAAPLIVLGRPLHVALWALSPRRSGAVAGPILRRRWVRWTLNVLSNPVVVLLLINVNLVIWHIPAFYVAALENTLIHELEHVLFMTTALLFWWVIIDPVPRHHRVSPAVAIVMLFVSGSVGDLIALYLIFSQDVILSFYLVNETVWGMSQLTDQRLAGLVMLVTGTVVYFGATFILIARNYGDTTPVGAVQAASVSRASDPA